MSVLHHNNRKIFYRSEGSGPPVLLIHGFGEDHNVWNLQVDHLKDRYRLIIPDLPGSGMSEMTKDMTMEGMALIMHEILQQEKIEKCPVIGHSMGGYIMLALVEKYPEDITAFGLLHSTAYPDTEEKIATRKKGIEFIKKNGAFEFLKTSTPNLFSPATKDKRPEMIDEFLQSLRNFSGESLVKYYESMIARPGRVDLLRKTPCPVLFVFGAHDVAVPLQDGLQQAHLPDISYLHILHNSGHMGMMEEADKNNKILVEFLSGL
jgi:pimeloyl-ACP methyl ester carboxylesterase